MNVNVDTNLCQTMRTDLSDQNAGISCLTRSNKQSTSLDNLDKDKKKKDNVYQVPREVPHVSGTSAKLYERSIKKCPSTPDLIFTTDYNSRYPIMEKQLKKTCLTDQMKKYQKCTGHKSGETPKEESEKDESVVRRRPRKTVQKMRPKSEVRESREETSQLY